VGVARGALGDIKPRFSGRFSCGVVIAAPGYPGAYPKGLSVDLSEAEALSGDALLFHASTARGPGGAVLTGGGRCFTSVGLGETWDAARASAYELAARVRFAGAWFRPDIGAKIFAR